MNLPHAGIRQAALRRAANHLHQCPAPKKIGIYASRASATFGELEGDINDTAKIEV